MALNDRASRASSSSPFSSMVGLEILGGGHVLGGRGQPLDRADGRPADRGTRAPTATPIPPSVTSHRMRRRSAQGVVDVGERTGDLDGATGVPVLDVAARR